MAIPTLALGAAASVVWAILLVVYRLYVSPLSKFPGSKLAISTECYEFYHQVVRGGQYPWVIQKMHEEYGMTFGSKAEYALNVDRTNHQDQST